MLPKVQVYNSLTRSKAPLTTLVQGKVGIYVCGITVYDLCHLGHARVMCAFDTYVRYLESIGYSVRLVRNITDIDDKIINRAAELGMSTEAVAATNIASMHRDFELLHLRQPDSEPRATQYIEPIIQLVRDLIDRGYGYVSEGRDVYFRVKRFADYGKLSGKNIEDLRSGARVDVNHSKEDPLDFVLWKAAKEGEPQWQSPWGMGRPGWHIECSAMSMRELGHDFDIHAGGPDLIFPHHENEIAQSCAAHDCNFAHYWMHAGPLRMGKDKMSKSLGNYVTIAAALEQFPADVWRMWFAMSHYRSPIVYQPELVEQAARVVDKLYRRVRDCDLSAPLFNDHPQVQLFHTAMRDDCNTPEALSALQALATEVPTATGTKRDRLGASVMHLARSIGLLHQDPEKWLTEGAGMSAEAIEDLIAERNQARQTRDFARADAIREQLTSSGVVLEDSAGGTSWRRH